jgi:predicted aldo/keto reductase-like oxidoreductase
MKDMAKIRLGKTDLFVEQNGFGALPIQRIPVKDAVYLLQKAQGGGMDFFDSSRFYTDSEQKLGEAFGGLQDKVVIATKTQALNASEFWDDLHESLRQLRRGHIDLYQFHNTPFCPKPGDESGLYDAMEEAKRQGKIRFIGITSHRLNVARDAVESGLYDTLQFPFSYLCSEQELALVTMCLERKIGFIAMKALAGGLITNASAACAFVIRFPHIVPIWGIQRETELDEFLSFIQDPPALTEELRRVIEKDRRELRDNFCRGCGYCAPCPAGIAIHTCARASLFMRRAPLAMLLSESGRGMMKKIEDCVECGQCAAKCPYGLDVPNLLKKNYADYLEVLAGKPL